MKLSIEQIRSIAKGCVRVTEADGKIQLLRFTKEQEEMYLVSNVGFYDKTFATAGVRLEFITDSPSISLKVDVSRSSSRTVFSHSIVVDGQRKYTLGADLADSPDTHVTLEGSFALGEGEKKVVVYFPWSVRSEIISLDIDNGAFVRPVEHTAKILLFGDSITHGYDAEFPDESYASLLTDAFGAEGFNKGIGGEVFRPELAALADGFTPDIVTVAYGTNDWGGRTKEEFDSTCEGFYKNLSALYPNSKIFALSPIWRGSAYKTTKVGSFDYLASKIKSVASALPNVTFIDCTNFVPHSAEMFAPDVLHPNSRGFSHYGKNLIDEIKKYI